MYTERTLDILKQALLLERRGKAFYAQVAATATDADVKEFFEMMAAEEDDHIRFLTEQYTYFQKHRTFQQLDVEGEVTEHSVAEHVLSEKIKEKLSASSYEAAAIAAAIDMETRAVKVYSERGKNAIDSDERAFYQFLANWESGHHKLLLDIDNGLKERVWNDNRFWPF